MRLRESFQLLNTKKHFFLRLFTLYILILFFSLSIVILVWNNNIRDTATTLSASNIRDVCNVINSNFAKDMESIYSCMNTVAKNEATTDFLKNPTRENAIKLRAYLDDACTLVSGDMIQGIAVMTENELAFGGYAYFDPNFQETEWYQHLLETDGKNVLFDRSTAYASKISVGTMLHSIGYTPSSYYEGVLVLELDNSFILDLFGIQTINGALRTVILDEQENVLFSNNRTSEGEYIADIIAKADYETYTDTLRPVTLNDKTYMMISQKLDATPGWVHITYLPQEYLYQDYESSLKFALVCVTLIFVFAVVLSLLMFAQLNTISNLEEKKHKFEIQVLKAQVNPHLIYNTLNVIQTLANLQKNERIANISGSLSKLLHYSVADTDKLVPLADEIHHVQAYLNIMQNKFINDISLFLTVEEELMDCRILKITLQPIVENCIKHGFSDTPNNHIMIKAYRMDDDVLIKITDNGKGIPEEKLQNILKDSNDGEIHLGIQNVDRRLKLTFGEQYGLEILSVPGVQTTVLIHIPFILEEHD